MNFLFSDPQDVRPRISIIMGGFGDGGMDIVFLALASGLISLGVEVDFVFTSYDTTDRKKHLPPEVKNFRVSHNTWLSVPGLIRYFRFRKPDAVITAVSEIDINTLIARNLSGFGHKFKVICTFHTHMTTHIKQAGIRAKIKQWIAERIYCYADHLVGVSRGVGADMEARLKLAEGTVKTIFNPVWSSEKEQKSIEKCSFDWLTASNVPVIIAAGRFNAPKNFPNLLRAFAILRKKMPVRLLILGDGEERSYLERMAIELGISEDVRMPGFVSNPLPYFRSASLYAMSSSWEGLPTVLIEALGCGLPIVSTDCKSGPSEILENGKFGELVPVNDPEALAAGMERVLQNPPLKDLLRRRAAFFSTEKIASEYLALSKK